MKMKYATIVVTTLILVAVLIPGPNLPSVGIGGFDKLVHIGLFGLWTLAIRYDFDSPDFKFVLVFLVGIIFSISTELLQLMVEGRSFDFYDMVADAFGLIIGLFVSGPIVRFVRKAK